MPKTNITELFVSRASYPLDRTKSTYVDARIESIGQEMYVGLYRKTYLLDEQLVLQIPKQVCVDSTEGLTSYGQQRSAANRESSTSNSTSDCRARLHRVPEPIDLTDSPVASQFGAGSEEESLASQ